MALRSLVDSLDDVPGPLREHYSQREDGRYHLQSDEGEKLGAALARERQRSREFEIQIADLRGKPRPKPESEMTAREKFMRQAQERLARVQPDTPEHAAEMEALEQEMGPLIQAEAAVERKRYESDIASLRSQIQRETIGQATRDIVREIARQDCAEILTPHVQARLGCELRNGKYELVVLDAAGKPTAHTVDALCDELRDAPNLQPFVTANSAQTKEAHQRRVQAMLTPVGTAIH